MIQLTENDIKYLVKECMNKLMLNESMTDIAFHFTTYEGLEGILSSNEFKLANQEDHYQKKASKTKPYYMCVTRQKYGDTGYGHERDDFNVRITLDGRLLNQRYKTIVYDYYAQNSAHTSRKQAIYDNGGKMPYKPSKIENEERLLSENPTIPNASKYILRIDIFNSNIYTDIYKEFSKQLGISDVVFLYRNKKDFNVQNKKCISISEALGFLDSIKQNIANGESLKNLFDYAEDLGNGYTTVGLNNNWNIIDTDGNLLYEKWFNWISSFIEGYAIVEKNGKYNFIDTNLNFLSKQWFDYAFSFNEGIAKVKLNGKLNYIDTEGNLLSFAERTKLLLANGENLRNIFSEYGRFSNGFARVKFNFKWNFIDKEGNFLYGDPNNTDTWFDSANDFESDGTALVSTGLKTTRINTDGKLFSNKEFKKHELIPFIIGFHEGISKINLFGKIWYVNNNFEYVTNKWFNEGSDFENGFAHVRLGNEWYYLDTEGNLYDENKNRIE